MFVLHMLVLRFQSSFDILLEFVVLWAQPLPRIHVGHSFSAGLCLTFLCFVFLNNLPKLVCFHAFLSQMSAFLHFSTLFVFTFRNHLFAATVRFSEAITRTWLCAASLLHRAFLFDGLMEEWIQLEKRVENPASSYYHLFITLPVSLAPSFRFLCCPPLLLFNRCIFSVGYWDL